MPRLNSNESLFTTKLQEILEGQQTKSIISWGENKHTIQINDKNLLLDKILPKYFRHNRFESFVRQMNLYGFKKIRSSKKHCFINLQLKNGKKLTELKSKNQTKREMNQNQRENELDNEEIRHQSDSQSNKLDHEKEINNVALNKYSIQSIEYFQKSQQYLLKQYQNALFYQQHFTPSIYQYNQSAYLTNFPYNCF